jgi:hypothetical protein
MCAVSSTSVDIPSTGEGAVYARDPIHAEIFSIKSWMYDTNKCGQRKVNSPSSLPGYLCVCRLGGTLNVERSTLNVYRLENEKAPFPGPLRNNAKRAFIRR